MFHNLHKNLFHHSFLLVIIKILFPANSDGEIKKFCENFIKIFSYKNFKIIPISARWRCIKNFYIFNNFFIKLRVVFRPSRLISALPITEVVQITRCLEKYWTDSFYKNLRNFCKNISKKIFIIFIPNHTSTTAIDNFLILEKKYIICGEFRRFFIFKNFQFFHKILKKTRKRVI
nr:MAG TPA: hypothetical protein [Caudoviricetes sp.]